MIKGIDITFVTKTEVGKDKLNHPIYKEEKETVENVIVAPASADEVISKLDLTGRKAVYLLGIPKGDTHDWENAEVEFFGHRWKAFGIPLEGMEHFIPLSWHRKVMVERYE